MSEETATTDQDPRDILRHPIQPLAPDSRGTIRFKENKIVSYLLEKGGIDLNHIAVQDFPREDRVQFAQLIGYSLGGWGDLSYVHDEDYAAADSMADTGVDEKDARIRGLEYTLETIRGRVRTAADALADVTPDDF